MINFDKSVIRQYARKLDMPLVDLITQLLKSDKKLGRANTTLFAACPNSEAVLKASIMAAKRANAPIKFAATLNQVDLDGGYTGWTQESFVRLVSELTEEVGFNGPVIIAVDHGGPWLKDLSAKNNWTLEQTMEALKVSFAASLFAGFDLIHVDPTVDKTLAPGQNIDIEAVIRRTVELISFVEGLRRRFALGRISYEVGTEEVHGGLADILTFRRFLDGLRKGLSDAGLSDVWPIFVVGKVGTDLDTTVFDPKVASELVRIAGEYGSLIKGHYTDYVDNPEDYPKVGMGAANIGPEFTEEEYKGLMELVAIEEKLYADGKLDTRSMIKEALKKAVVMSGRWKKWRKPEEMDMDFDHLGTQRQEWLIKTGSRYIWTNPEVVAARRLLYSNLNNNNVDAENIVLEKIIAAMMKYYEAFNLVNLNDYLKGSSNILIQEVK
ncbi:MAG: class II D-tagatose-bisphosphate aldolase non-catalytic subunit [Clostridia bacterium]